VVQKQCVFPLKSDAAAPAFRFFLTDASDRFKRIAPLFLGFEAEEVQWVDLGP
jgi:hypothetical protein